MARRGRYANAGKRQHHGLNRAGREFSSPYRNPAWPGLRAACFHRDGYRCVSCGARHELQADHVVPLSRGGAPLDLANLQTLCRPCNSAKSDSDGFRGFDFDLDTGRFAAAEHPTNKQPMAKVRFLK